MCRSFRCDFNRYFFWHFFKKIAIFPYIFLHIRRITPFFWPAQRVAFFPAGEEEGLASFLPSFQRPRMWRGKKGCKKRGQHYFSRKKGEAKKERVFSSFLEQLSFSPPPPHFGGGGGSSCRGKRIPLLRNGRSPPEKKLFPFFSVAPPAVAVGSRKRGGGGGSKKLLTFFWSLFTGGATTPTPSQKLFGWVGGGLRRMSLMMGGSDER